MKMIYKIQLNSNSETKLLIICLDYIIKLKINTMNYKCLFKKNFQYSYSFKFLNSWVFSGYSARPVYSEYNSNERLSSAAFAMITR